MWDVIVTLESDDGCRMWPPPACPDVPGRRSSYPDVPGRRSSYPDVPASPLSSSHIRRFHNDRQDSINYLVGVDRCWELEQRDRRSVANAGFPV